MEKDIFSVKGKKILITGSTKGIGETLAIELSKLGASVIAHGRDERTGKKLIEDYGCQFIKCDLSKEMEVREMAKKILKEEDKIDVLINNAGVEEQSSIANMNMEVYDKVNNVCTRSHYLLTSLLLPLLKKSGNSSIINITSIHQNVPVRELSSYCMAKAAMEMFTKVSALEFAKYGIRVNSLAPGAIETDMNRELIAKLGHDKFGEWIPEGRVGNTDEIVGPVVFLSSDSSSYITGTTIYVDGGYTQNLLRY